MKLTVSTLTVALGLLALASLPSTSVGADSLAAPTQAKVDGIVKDIQTWAADPALVSAVKAQNTALPPDYAAMNQDKWKTLSVLDPFVRGFSKNPVGEFLKKKKSEVLAEAFVSDANGLKVGFLSKTSGWSHKGKPKHDVPMTGKTWQGQVEMDESTGLQTVQVSVPVLDGDKAIGSLVVGLSVAKLSQ
ncbi:MAG: hypothetical protein HZA90_28575 [Verrucomicrobia bacterium]|nr:hypothetical protein [Verrucomicrobiota bacterium]